MSGMATRRKAAALAVIFIIILAWSNVNAQGENPLFSAAAELDVSAQSRDRMADQGPAVMRSRLVRLNTALVTDQSVPVGDESLLLNLFGDTNLVAVKDRLDVRPDGQYVWQGHVKDVDGSSVIIVVNGIVLIANVTLPGHIFEVRQVEGVIHSIREVDQSQLGREQEPQLPPASLESQPDLPVKQMDGAGNVDVLVVYTPAAMAEAGSMAAMEAEITAAETSTNQAFTNSGLLGYTITVVGKFLVSYTESGNISDDLDRLTFTDGYIDGVHDLRNQYAADCVVMLTGGTGSTAGIAWLYQSGGFESYAYSVVLRSASVSYFTFAHELGHNLGLRHDCYVDSTLTPDEDGHGYVDTTNKFMTIMSYNNECADSGFNCTRIQYFSNPAVNYLTHPTGNVPGGGACGSDNHQRVINTNAAAANWRQAADRTTDADGDGVPSGVDINDGNAQIASPAATTGSGKIIINAAGAGNLSLVAATSDYSGAYNQLTRPSNMVFPHGLVRFQVAGAFVAGDSIQVTLTFPTAIPAGAKYYKVNNLGNFYEYPNVVFGTNTATLTLTDNGDGDHDSTAGVILDPGGLAVPGTPIASGGGGGGGGGGCFIRSSNGI